MRPGGGRDRIATERGFWLAKVADRKIYGKTWIWTLQHVILHKLATTCL